MTTDIGSRIRRAREQRGLTIRDIASTTKISTGALHAIERNDFARLPGGVFRRAYVRAFATEVGLNADELAREYRARFEAEIPAGPGPLMSHEPNRGVRLRTFYLLEAALVTIIGIMMSALAIVNPDQVPQEPPNGRWTMNRAVGDPANDTMPTVESDGTKEAAFANAAAETTVPPLRLEIRLDGACWVSAVADGERVLYRLMQAGEGTLVEARSAITLRVGDAGTVDYSINGVPGRPLGQDGEAVTVHITGDDLRSLYADPATALPREDSGGLGGGRVSFNSRPCSHAAFPA